MPIRENAPKQKEKFVADGLDKIFELGESTRGAHRPASVGAIDADGRV
jgi:hypothetical protein